jgi:hypothetical protein
MVYITHTLKEILVMWKGLDWESSIAGLLEAKVTFKMVVYVCDKEFFRHLFTTILKSIFIKKVRFEFGQYMVGVVEGTSFSKGPMEGLVFFLCLFIPM